MNDTAGQLTAHELWLQSTDQANTPHIFMTGSLIWNGTNWEKWDGDITIEEFPDQAPITDNFTNPTTTNIMAMNMVWDGTGWDRVGGSGATGIFVDLRTDSIGFVETENTAHNTGDKGVMALAVRNDGFGPLTTSDGQYSPISTQANGDVNVRIRDGGNEVDVTALGELSVIDTNSAAIKDAVEIVDDWDDNDAANTFPKPYAERYAINTGDGDIAYHGWAVLGASTGDSIWRMRRITNDAVTAGDVDIEWADGNSNFDNEWDNRQTLSYS